jgi:hypothetical protein
VSETDFNASTGGPPNPRRYDLLNDSTWIPCTVRIVPERGARGKPGPARPEVAWPANAKAPDSGVQGLAEIGNRST